MDRPEPLEGADVAIEFTHARRGPGQYRTGCRFGNSGGGRHHRLAGASGCKRARLWSSIGSGWSGVPNFSIGVNVFTRLVSEAARLLKDEPEYGAWAWEIHHLTKKDAPSGTLLKLVEAMKTAGYARPIDVSSNRAGAHPGTHEIGFDSAADTITLRHTARSREGFARGA